MADVSKIRINNTNYNLKDNKARVIYIDIEPGEEGFITSDGLTYAELKAMTEEKDNIVCLRYGERRWYLVNSSTTSGALAGDAEAGDAVLGA